MPAATVLFTVSNGIDVLDACRTAEAIDPRVPESNDMPGIERIETLRLSISLAAICSWAPRMTCSVIALNRLPAAM